MNTLGTLTLIMRGVCLCVLIELACIIAIAVASHLDRRRNR